MAADRHLEFCQMSCQMYFRLDTICPKAKFGKYCLKLRQMSYYGLRIFNTKDARHLDV